MVGGWWRGVMGRGGVRSMVFKVILFIKIIIYDMNSVI